MFSDLHYDSLAYACFSSLVSGTIIEIVYGHKVSSSDDKYMRLVDETTRLTGEIGSIGTTIIDLLPFRA